MKRKILSILMAGLFAVSTGVATLGCQPQGGDTGDTGETTEEAPADTGGEEAAE